jgi:hypothetical protein
MHYWALWAVTISAPYYDGCCTMAAVTMAAMAALHYGGWYDAARCPMRRRGAVTVSAPYYACMCLWRRCTMGATAHYGGAAALWRRCRTMAALHYGDGWCDAARCTMAALPMTALHYDGADGALL